MKKKKRKKYFEFEFDKMKMKMKMKTSRVEWIERIKRQAGRHIRKKRILEEKKTPKKKNDKQRMHGNRRHK